VKINEASQETRAKINAIRNELPEAMKEPVIQKLDFAAFPIISLAVRSNALGPRDLTTLVDRKVKRRLENISGVGKAKLVGSSKREVGILIDPAAIEAIGMGVDEVIGGLRTENVNTPLGRLNRDTTGDAAAIAGSRPPPSPASRRWWWGAAATRDAGRGGRGGGRRRGGVPRPSSTACPRWP
jgi:HAE1 family hydrophobic/amphiphilic exporter-1